MAQCRRDPAHGIACRAAAWIDGRVGHTLRDDPATLRGGAQDFPQAQCAFRRRGERGRAVHPDPSRRRRADGARPRGGGDSRRAAQDTARHRRRPAAACHRSPRRLDQRGRSQGQHLHGVELRRLRRRRRDPDHQPAKSGHPGYRTHLEQAVGCG